jgi:hypothetical protein
MAHCDICGKDRRDVQAMGRDANGDPDAPDVCFLCRVEDRRGRTWSYKLRRYVPYAIAEQYDSMQKENF